MERVLSVYQMQQADKFTIEKLGICQEELVKRAGNNELLLVDCLV